MLFDNVEKFAQAINTAGERAIKRAKQAGAPVYYMDPSLGDGIIKELPDGTKQRVEVYADHDVVLETLDTSFRP
jgi:predicted aldo/keto reductase-like oxidoreductase